MGGELWVVSSWTKRRKLFTEASGGEDLFQGLPAIYHESSNFDNMNSLLTVQPHRWDRLKSSERVLAADLQRDLGAIHVGCSCLRGDTIKSVIEIVQDLIEFTQAIRADHEDLGSYIFVPLIHFGAPMQYTWHSWWTRCF